MGKPRGLRWAGHASQIGGGVKRKRRRNKKKERT
jgi:hypothetical protein